jgi:hypothetical protein
LLDGRTVHFEDAWTSHDHPDCTLCSRVTVATSEEVTDAWKDSGAERRMGMRMERRTHNRHYQNQGRGPPRLG